MNRSKPTHGRLGSISHGTLRTADLLPEFLYTVVKYVGRLNGVSE